MSRTDAPERAFVLGLDGVPWYLVDRWTSTGDLPNFARLIEEGAGGTLESTSPPMTPLAWPSIATGTWPDRHGVYGFKELASDHTQRMNTGEHVRQPELWDVVSPARVGNVPMTYPATELDGTMVTGMSTPSMYGRSTHPPSFAAELRERIPDYRIGLQWSEYKDRRAEFLADLSELVADRRELMRLLMEFDDWRLFFFVYTAPDRLQHLIWEDDPLLDHYRTLDGIVGEVMEYAAANDAVLFVVSDHGFGPISTHVYVNRILEEAGYLVRRERTGTRGALSRLGVSREDIQSVLSRVGISDELLLDHLPEGVVDRVAAQLPGEHSLFDVDHFRTRAFFFGSGTLFINDTERFDNGIVAPDDVPGLKRELTALLEAVTDPNTGEAALTVADGDDLFPRDDRAPDLVVEGRDGYEPAKSITDRVFDPTEGRKAAGHRSAGLFLAWGHPIAPGTAPTDATVVDVAPTLLHCLGEPIGETMDGRVLREVLQPDAAERAIELRRYASRRAAPNVPDEEDYSGVESRLRGLGYLE